MRRLCYMACVTLGRARGVKSALRAGERARAWRAWSVLWLRPGGRLSLLCAGHQGTFERRRSFGGSPSAYMCAGRHLAASAVAEGSTSAALAVCWFAAGRHLAASAAAEGSTSAALVGGVGGGPRAASRLHLVFRLCSTFWGVCVWRLPQLLAWCCYMHGIWFRLKILYVAFFASHGWLYICERTPCIIYT